MALTKITAGGLADDSVDSDAYVNTSIDAAHLASGVGGSWVKLQSTTASDSSEVDMETGIDSTYDVYMITGTSIVSASDQNTLLCRLKIGGTYKTGSSDYSYHADTSNMAVSWSGVAAEAASSYMKMSFTDQYSNGDGEDGDFRLYFHDPENTSKLKKVYWDGFQNTQNNDSRLMQGAGFYTGSSPNAALTGVRFFFNSGAVASGIFTTYGLTK